MYFIKMVSCTLRYVISVCSVTQQIHLKQCSKQQLHKLTIGKAIHPSSTLVNYETNVYQRNSAEINFGHTKLLYDVLEASGRWIILGGGGTPWLHSPEHSIWPSMNRFNHLTTNGSCQRVNCSSRCQINRQVITIRPFISVKSSR